MVSGSLMNTMLDYILIPKIPLPPFMHELQDLMPGGIPLGVILTMGSASGTGKTTIVDELCYYLFFNSPHKIGAVTMEADSAMYGRHLLSRHVGNKINLIESVEGKLEFLQNPAVIEAADKLWYDEEGDDRFFLVEERDASIEELQELISALIISCDCKVIVLDPISDVFEGYPLEDQQKFCKWMKGMTKTHLVTFIRCSSCT